MTGIETIEPPGMKPAAEDGKAPGPSFADKRLAREWQTIAAMIRCYCRGHHATGDNALPGMPGAAGLCYRPARALPLRRGEARLRQMSGALLSACPSGAGQSGDALRGPANALAASDPEPPPLAGCEAVKSEARKPKSEGRPKSEIRIGQARVPERSASRSWGGQGGLLQFNRQPQRQRGRCLRASDFGFPSDFGFRVSDLAPPPVPASLTSADTACSLVER